MRRGNPATTPDCLSPVVLLRLWPVWLLFLFSVALLLRSAERPALDILPTPLPLRRPRQMLISTSDASNFKAMDQTPKFQLGNKIRACFRRLTRSRYLLWASQI